MFSSQLYLSFFRKVRGMQFWKGMTDQDRANVKNHLKRRNIDLDIPDLILTDMSAFTFKVWHFWCKDNCVSTWNPSLVLGWIIRGDKEVPFNCLTYCCYWAQIIFWFYRRKRFIDYLVNMSTYHNHITSHRSQLDGFAGGQPERLLWPGLPGRGGLQQVNVTGADGL